MNKKEYKKKVAELLSFKSPKSEKYKKITQDVAAPLEQTEQSNETHGEQESAMAARTSSASDITLYGKKRDVIIIGAGLSGKFLLEINSMQQNIETR